MEKLVQLTSDLIRFQSYTGNNTEIKNCLNYCHRYFKNQNVFVKEVDSNGIHSMLISNKDTLDLDVLILSHVDVIPAESSMFEPRIEEGKLYGRGAIDMKSFVAVTMKVLENIVNENIKIKCGILIVGDEETGGINGTKHWIEKIGLKAKIVLDPDGGKDIKTMIEKNKAIRIVKLISTGEEAHGSRPWLGLDANEQIFQTIHHLRKYFPYYSQMMRPADSWSSSMHVATIKGGTAINKVAENSEAILDFRLTEDMVDPIFTKLLDTSITKGVKYEITVQSECIYMDQNNKFLQTYSDCIEEITKSKTLYNNSSGSSGSRYFAKQNSVIIIHQGTGGGPHTKNEWVDVQSLLQLEQIQTCFIKRVAGMLEQVGC